METFNPKKQTGAIPSTDTLNDSMPQIGEQDASKEVDNSFFIRTKLGRLGLRMVSDPLLLLTTGSFSLNMQANMHNPNVLNATIGIANGIVAGIQASALALDHLKELKADNQNEN